MDARKPCVCTDQQIQKYRSRISGPLLDRIDLHIEVPPVDFQELRQASGGEPSAVIRQRVESARQIQRQRFAKRPGIHCNAHMVSRDIKHHCQLDGASLALLENAMNHLGMSARSYDRILKVARTIADLEHSESIQHPHLGEAIQFRTLDRS